MTSTQKKSKAWIFHTVIFLVIFAMLFAWVSYLFRPTAGGRLNVIGFYAEPEDSLDVVFIGGSSTMMCWMPYEAWNDYGIASYSFSVNSMSPALLKGLMKEADAYQDPQLYVIDLRAFEQWEQMPGYYTESYLRNITDSMLYSRNRTETIRYAFGFEQKQKQYAPESYLDLMLYHSRWREMGIYALNHAGNDVPQAEKGYYFNYYSYHVPYEMIDCSQEEGVLPLTGSNQVLIDLLEYCKEENHNVLFFLNPFCMTEGAETKQRYNYIAQVVESYGFPFLETNEHYEEMDLDFSRDFSDIDHTNVLGAEKFTRFVGSYLDTHYDLPDRRGDPAYSRWEQGYTQWLPRYQEHKQTTQEVIRTGMIPERKEMNYG